MVAIVGGGVLPPGKAMVFSHSQKVYMCETNKKTWRRDLQDNGRGGRKEKYEKAGEEGYTPGTICHTGSPSRPLANTHQEVLMQAADGSLLALHDPSRSGRGIRNGG